MSTSTELYGIASTEPSPRVLFAPVSGPHGVGEYQRCVFLAQELRRRHRDWDVRLIVAEEAPFVNDVPVPIFRTSRSPTEVPDEVDAILSEFRPRLVVFDCSGRQRSLRRAHELGAATVFVSNHTVKRWKGFRLSRLRYTDDHWILQPRSIAGDVTLIERLKLRWLDKNDPVFLGPVFPRAALPVYAPARPFFVCCPGGGGHDVAGRQSGAVFADAAARVASAADMPGVVVTGNNYTGELLSHPRLTVRRAVPGDELAGLLASAELALVGGGDLLPQAIAAGTPAFAAPVASDQHRRVRDYERAGLCVATTPEGFADAVLATGADGRAALRERVQRSGIRNGLQVGVERIEALLGRAAAPRPERAGPARV